MKKVLLIMAAALMTLAQCRKQETSPATPSANTIKMTVTAGPGAKTNITDDGAITWTSGDKLYVSDGTKWLGSLDLQSGADNASGTFTGSIAAVGEGVTTCHFFYLGHDNDMTGATGTTNAVISFASQDGSREGALKYHLGHGSADVTVSGGVATGAVAMRTEIAMAHLKLKMDGADYKGKVTMDVSNTMTVSPAGSFSGGGNGIAIDGGESGDRYVTLIPTEATNVSFSGSATGSLTFGHGIQANNLYGMENGIEVTLTAPSYLPGEFTINSGGTKVKFSKGNLYYDGTDNKWKFEANQWDFRTYNGKGSCINGTYNANVGTPAADWGLFGWSTASNDYGKNTWSGSSYYSGDFKDWGTAPGLPSAGEGKTWHTLSKAEWDYLLNTRDNASSFRAWKDLDNNVKGLVILPDGTDASVMGRISSTADLATSGAVFLPAAGYRNGTDVYSVGYYGYYWSGTPNGTYDAYYMYFHSNGAGTSHGNNRYEGHAVRLVR